MITIKDKKNCCGCWACADACAHKAITMTEDFEGFRYPVVDEDKCVDCGLCDKVCPIINVEAEQPKAQRGYLLQHRDIDVLRDSTSGGAFTALGQWVISQGGVVFGAAFTDGWQVRHVMVDTEDGLSRFRNSKYVQSQIGDVYKECKKILSGGKTCSLLRYSLPNRRLASLSA